MIKTKESGFTLIEIIISIAIVIVMAGFAGFGLSYLYETNIEAKAENMANLIRSTRNVQVEKSGETYYIDFDINADKILIRQIKESQGADEIISTIELSGFELDYNGGSGSTYSAISSTNKIRFSNSTSKVLEGSGIYRMSRGNNLMKIKLQEENGRVIVSEE